MLTLTQAAVMSRKAIKYTIYAIVLLIIGRIVLGASYRIFRTFFPKAPPPPTVAFNKLPALAFPGQTRPENLTFTLETPEGSLPKLPTQAKVYFMPAPSSSLISLDIAKRKASQLGFSPEAQQVSDTIYRFPNLRAPATLEMNIISGVFSLSYNLASDKSPLSKRPPTATLAATQVKEFLSSAGLLPADLSGRVEHDYLTLQEGKFISALSLSEAQLVKINLYRKDFDKFPTLTSKPNEANVWFIVSGESNREKQIIAGIYHYFPVDEDKASTYPIKTAEAAWEELKTGGGYIASDGQNPNGQIVVRRVYLAYYDSGVVSQFFQPMIVFEGDRGFMAYVPAVTPEYYGN